MNKASHCCYKALGWQRNLSLGPFLLKGVETVLPISLTHMRLILDAMPNMAWIKDVDGRYLAINKRFEKFCIRKGVQILGNTDRAIFPEDMVKRFQTMEAAVMQTKTPQNADHYYQTPTGGTWYDTHIAPMLEQDGQVSGTIGFARRISRRKELEAELKRQKDFLKTMMDTIPDFIFYKDTNSRILGCNKPCQDKLYGIPEQQAVGKTILEITKNDRLAAKCLQYDTEVLTTGKMVRIEENMLLVDGMLIESETIKTPFFDDEGRITGLIGISRDITARKRLERQLKESQERYAAIINNAPEIVLIHRGGIITYINNIGLQITGYKREDVIGRHLTYFLTQQSAATVSAAMPKTAKGEMVDAYDIGFITKAGEVRNGLVRAARITVGGEQAILVVLIDVTEKKRIEDKLRASEEQIQREIELAARVQQDSLPPPLNETKVQVRPIFLPYHTVSGDLINYRWFEKSKKFCGYIVDVSGHGMATALQTATVKMLLDDRLLGGGEINETDFQEINQSMVKYLYEESFAGLMYFEFDFNCYLLKVITGGIHFFLAAKADTCELVPVFSGYLGMFDKAELQTMTMPFRPGDVYCMMSDGASDLIELHGVKRQSGFTQYLTWFEQLAAQPERSDDFSVVCIKIREKNTVMLLESSANQDELAAVQVKIATFLEQQASEHAGLLEVAVNEAVNNGLSAGNRVWIKLKRAGKRLMIRVRDNGPGFDAKRQAPAGAKDLEARLEQLSLAERGRGIMMMQMFCDQIKYNAQGNQVLLVKKL